MKHYAKYILAIATAVLLTACTDSNKTITVSINTSGSPSASAGTVVIDGKEWMRCSLGQTWENNTCTGEAKRLTFDEAKAAAQTLNNAGYAGRRDWRVPTVRELQSLRFCSTGFESKTRDIQDGRHEVALSCNGLSANPTIDITNFPKTIGNHGYWSSSPYTGDNNSSWFVDFGNGVVYYFDSGYGFYARLVRVSQ